MKATLLRETPLLIGILVLIGLESTTLLDWLLLQPALPVLTGLGLLSLLVLLMARGVAHHADQLAERLGEPLGTLVLTGSVIVIELALIASTMLTGDSNPTLARDSMFSVLMIVLTGVKGVTVIVAARVQRQGRTQPMQPEDLATVNQSGSRAYINLITTISVLALVLPNFSQDSLEANYSLPINWLLTFVSISLYGIFLRGQVGRYRNLFIATAQPQSSGTLSLENSTTAEPTPEDEHQASILRSGALMAAGLLVLVLTLVLVRPISGRVSELDGLMLLTVGLVWVALQVVS